MYDVYSGTLGTFFNKDEVVFKLQEYIANTTDNLAYEIMEDQAKVVIITGKNDREKDLPSFQHPIIFKGLRGNDIIACDLRAYMKSKLDNIISVRENLQDKYNGNLQLYRLILTKQFLDQDVDWLAQVRVYGLEAFSAIIKTVTSMIIFDETNKDAIEIISKLHFLTMDEEGTIDKVENLISMLPRQDLQRLLKGDLKQLYIKIVDGYNNKELTFPSTTIGSLTRNIAYIIDGNRGDGLTADIYIQALSRGFFSLDSRELSIAMVEDLPTFYSVMIMVITEGINSKSNFRKILNGNKRFVKPDDFSKKLLHAINEDFID